MTDGKTSHLIYVTDFYTHADSLVLCEPAYVAHRISGLKISRRSDNTLYINFSDVEKNVIEIPDMKSLKEEMKNMTKEYVADIQSDFINAIKDSQKGIR